MNHASTAATGPRLSRREALLAAIASGSLGCQSRTRARLQAASDRGAEPGAAAGAGPWGGLEVANTGSMRADETGGIAVVLLHGWGAAADDLLPLAHALAQPRTRFFLPGAPLPEVGGGRAWWHLDASDRPAFSGDGPPAPGHKPHRHVIAARAAVQAVLRTIKERHAPDRLVLGGFSQGAMLSLDVAGHATPAVDQVVALSGVLLAESLAALQALGQKKPPAVFISHGRQDPVLAFRGGERAKELLEKNGFPVTWRPFDGGHEIPAAIVKELRSFISP